MLDDFVNNVQCVEMNKYSLVYLYGFRCTHRIIQSIVFLGVEGGGSDTQSRALLSLLFHYVSFSEEQVNFLSLLICLCR